MAHCMETWVLLGRTVLTMVKVITSEYLKEACGGDLPEECYRWNHDTPGDKTWTEGEEDSQGDLED